MAADFDNTTVFCLSGPLEGQCFDIGGAECTFGRNPENKVVVPSSSVSRHHCILRWNDGAWSIEDLDSFNGTFVNGCRITTSPVRSGEPIQIGTSVFCLVGGETDLPLAVPVQDGTRPIDPAFIKQFGSVTIQAGPSSVLDECNASFGAARALLKISDSLHSVLDPEQVASRLLDLSFQALQAERGYVLLENSENLSIVSQKGVGDHAVEKMLVDRVLASGTAMLREPDLLVIPISAGHRVFGVLYLLAAPGEVFQEEHLRIGLAVGGIAGAAMQNALGFTQVAIHNRNMQKSLHLQHRLVGESAGMRKIYDFIAQASASEAPVLITGESGTGKELVAQAIHRNSARIKQPFVAVNCAAIAEALFESEMFGFEKGAFTGAAVRTKGLMESAHRGTLFLDEVGELPLNVQAKLLRAIQEREVRRVGSTLASPVDVRIIAATNRNLRESMDRKLFREDLFYRLHVLPLLLPPLRDREGDTLMLANFFLKKHGDSANRAIKGFSPKARKLIQEYSWPGNVRELENAIQRACVLGYSDLIEPEDLPEHIWDSAKGPDSVSGYQEALTETKRELVRRTLAECKGSVSAAARSLGVHRNYVYRLIESLGLKEAGSGGKSA